MSGVITGEGVKKKYTMLDLFFDYANGLRGRDPVVFEEALISCGPYVVDAGCENCICDMHVSFRGFVIG